MKNLLQSTLAVLFIFAGIMALIAVPDEHLQPYKFITILVCSKLAFALCLWAAWRIYRKGE